jgi:AcrR family transcriptional regulator
VARTRNPAQHALKRDAFVDAAQHLIATRGFEQMSIQDVLDALDASRGAFYHYFDSKVALLEAVVEHMMLEVTAALEVTLGDPSLSALDKLTRLLNGIVDYKNQRTELLRGFLRVWQSDDNVLVRDRLRQMMVVRLTPLLAAIVRQGCDEGTFSCVSPNATARVLVSLWQGLSDLATELFLERQTNSVSLEEVEHMVDAYLVAFERILGLPTASLPRNRATLLAWFG